MSVYNPSASGGTPASPSGSIQFNNAGAFGGSANLAWDNSTNTETLLDGSLALSKSNVAFASEAAPGAPSAARVATSSGNMTNGTHSFRLTYVTAQGETGNSSGTASLTVDATHKQISLTAIPTGTAGIVTGRNIYMTKAGGSVYFRLGTGTTIADNTTTAFTVNIADGSISSILAPLSNSTSGAVSLNGCKVGQFDSDSGIFGARGFTSDINFGADNAGAGNAGEHFGLRSSANLSGGSAFGFCSSASGYDSSVFGSLATASGNQSAAFGARSCATTSCSVAAGYFSYAVSSGASAFGAGSCASALCSTASGYASVAAFQRSTALGNGATTFSTDQVVSSQFDMYLGGGQGGGVTCNGYHAAGISPGHCNQKGSALILASGIGTGNSDAADIGLQWSQQNMSGGTLQNALVDAMRGYGTNGRFVFTGRTDIPPSPGSFADFVHYPDGSFYRGYSTSLDTQGYRLYARKFDPIANGEYYSPVPAAVSVTNSDAQVAGDNPSSGNATIPAYGIGTGTYVAANVSHAYQIYGAGMVNGVLIYGASPASASVQDNGQQVLSGDATLASAVQNPGGSYAPASSDTFSYGVYAHATYNGLDVYSASPANASVALDGVTDPFQVALSWTDATFPTGATVKDYTIVKSSSTYGTQYVAGVPVGGAYSDNDPALWTNGSPTLSPNSIGDAYGVLVTWTDPVFNVAVDPGTEFIEITRTGPGDSVNVAVGMQSFSDTGNSVWTGTPVTSPTFTQSYFRNDLSWTAVSGADNYKLFYSPNNFVGISQNSPSFVQNPVQTDFSGSYSVASGTADGSNIQYNVYAYETISAVRVYSSSPLYLANTDNSDGNPYGWQIDFAATTFDPASTGNGYMLVRNINGAGFNDYLDIGNVVTFLDSNNSWITGSVPGIGNVSGIIEYSILTGFATAFTDTAAISWTNNYAVTPSASSMTTVTLNPPGAGIDVNGAYQLTAIVPPGSGYVQVSGTGDVPMIWRVLPNGTVTSVGLASSGSTITVSGSPITGSGTINADLNLAHANTWTGKQTFNTSAPLIGTATASTIAGFDASKNLITLATATYPSLTELSYVKGVTSAIQTQINGKQATITPGALTKTDDTNVTMTLGGTPTSALLQASSMTLGWTGTLAVSRGGTGSSTLVGAGIVGVVASVQLTNQSADIGSTNFANTSTAGLYRISYSLEDTTSDVTAGAVTLTIAYTATAGAITVPSSAQILTGVGLTQGTIFAQLASGSVSYSTAHTGLFGTAKYALYMTAERLA